jgi:hypothetical protein
VLGNRARPRRLRELRLQACGSLPARTWSRRTPMVAVQVRSLYENWLEARKRKPKDQQFAVGCPAPRRDHPRAGGRSSSAPAA